MRRPEQCKIPYIRSERSADVAAHVEVVTPAEHVAADGPRDLHVFTRENRIGCNARGRTQLDRRADGIDVAADPLRRNAERIGCDAEHTAVDVAGDRDAFRPRDDLTAYVPADD